MPSTIPVTTLRQSLAVVVPLKTCPSIRRVLSQYRLDITLVSYRYHHSIMQVSIENSICAWAKQARFVAAPWLWRDQRARVSCRSRPLRSGGAAMEEKPSDGPFWLYIFQLFACILVLYSRVWISRKSPFLDRVPAIARFTAQFVAFHRLFLCVFFLASCK